MKIYTKTGDAGQTSLFSGERVSKAHKLIQSFGLLDELNTGIGVLICSLRREELKEFNEFIEFFENLQSQIFSLGSYLASECKDKRHILNILKWVDLQETYMDKLDGELKPLKNFILPGGSSFSCKAHYCRVLARKAERCVVGIELGLKTGPVILYLNRLSDLFFVFARWINHIKNIEEPIWKN